VREQAIAHKVGNRSGIGSHRRSTAATQRPTRRESGGQAFVARLRSIVGYVPIFLKAAVAIIVGVLMFAGYRAAASASFFQVHKIEVQGASRVPADEVQAIIRKDVEKTGVWNADVKALNAKLEKLLWVRTAVVSRVLPDGIRVRITERMPRAVVRTASGRFRWIDDDAVLLGEMLPTDQMPPFFMRGLNEDDPEGAASENRDRVAKFIELQRDWEAAGLSERVSEVNVMDVRDVRAQLAGEDAHIEVRLGSQDQAKRFKDALNTLDGQRQSPRGSLISYIDMSLGRRAIVGLATGAHAIDRSEPTAPDADTPIEKPAEPETTTRVPLRDKATSDSTARLDTKSEKRRAEARSAADKKSDQTKKTERRKP